MTLSDINRIADIFASVGARIPICPHQWREYQMARIGAATVKTDPKTGKSRIKPVDKRPTHRKIADKAKTTRKVAALKQNREGKR